MIPLFEAARIKVARADHHIKDLQSQIDNFFAEDNVYVAFELADEYTKALGSETGAFVYRQKSPVPPIWSAIIGDAIHNMRSALDLVVSELHHLTGGRPEHTSRVQYPFCKNKNDLSDTIKSRRLSHIGREFLELIAETAPYKGGNEGLRAIHDLDVLDKHQSLLATIAVVQMDWPVPVADRSKFATGIMKDGQRLIIFPRAFARELRLGARINAEFVIAFGDAGVFTGRGVVMQLQSCSASIGVIIERFASIASKKPIGGANSSNS